MDDRHDADAYDAPAPYAPTIRDQIDLEDLWHDLLAPLGFSTPGLWMVIIGPDDRPLPQILEVTDADELPAPGDREGLVEVLRHTAAELPPGTRVAFLRSRPGSDEFGLEDRRWAAMLYAAAQAAEVACETVHAANDVRLAPIPWEDLPPDELPLTRPA